MIKTVSPASLRGKLRVIPSKSASHRAVMLASLAASETSLEPIQLSRDIEATLECAKALGLASGAEITPHELPGFSRVRLCGGQSAASGTQRVLDCGESGSTLRFFIPLALDGRGSVRFVGHGRLMQRPLELYERLFVPRGIRWQLSGDTLLVEGRLTAGEYALRGDVSSQFITGLLLALPGLDGESVIRVTTRLESRAYVELTRRIQASFGVVSHWEDESTLVVPGRQRAMSPGAFSVEGDWSHAAFYLVAGSIGAAGPLLLSGLDRASTQGDRAIVPLLQSMGALIREEEGGLCVCPSRLHGITADVEQTPDLVPTLAVAMAAAQGESRITGAQRLRIKESDRLAAMRAALCAAGAEVTELPDGLVIRGGKRLHGATIDGCNDHRIVMAMAVASAIADGDLVISDAEAVAKSAPAFWAEFASLGGIAR
ncbi:MAG: 3-phosphoshikimate 1-carboxyvinyltransferase [Clostridia bacterium]|nr:3-phosphoshikimate 1-carboxyvinyltransferase [Clostridia bacterium]